MGRAILNAILPLRLAALVLGACSEDGGESDQSQTGTGSRGDGAGTAKVRTVPEYGNLPTGRYSTGERFEPSVSFELGEGWLGLRPSEPSSLKVGYSAPGQEVAQGERLRFLNVWEVFEPRERDGGVLFEAKPVPDDLVAWLQRHPYVDTKVPKQVFVGRIPGKQLEADVDVPEGYRDVQGAAARYLAYHCLDSAATHLTEEGKDRFIIEDVQGEAAIIIVSATADMFGEFLPTAQKALDTFEWTSHRSTQTLLPDVGE